MKEFFTLILYQPLFNALAWLYQHASFMDLGVAIILMTTLVRVVLFPLFHKTAKHQRVTQDLQPEIKKIQKKHKDDKEAQAKHIMELYNRHKVNPLTPIFVLLIQLPIIFSLYKIFINGFTEESMVLLYPFIDLSGVPGHTFLGLVDLTSPNLVIAGFAAAFQYIQGKISLSKKGKNTNKEELSQAEKLGKRMIFIMPGITLAILYNLPAAVGLYWTTTTLFSIFQQFVVNRSTSGPKVDNDDGKDVRENKEDN
ncbi:MAG: hypothetical protein COT88_00630 [Candidatus Colwellbacteria bacterium CG10_big_fil_rev_8_21_14_0_10_41_28]|uniref:Membrane insertase YidC/Oxa/ALB C-terminal domain-containing protein n=1 Tax=Candidatus Colwellbacteria bacterium CG10_big_fil_rev_8_21_14_0_10_41_28 TaxID=1974539 RepID=A0A2H0VHK8_9BACT|nr:MAG: hypothetical protein COT88_00630 [Candidatus Colwellbacteria bacterium CG10_big_fil_rev_8_21_14_0_10_41_28]